MGVKLYTEYKDYLQNEWRIEVIDTSFSGTASEFNCGTGGAIIEWDGEDRNIISDGIRPSICSFEILIDALTGGSLNTYLESIVLYTDQKVYLKLYLKVSSVWTVKWHGLVNQTGFEFPDEADYSFTMTANDGLALLKDKPFTYASDSGTDAKITILDTLTTALRNAPTDNLYAPTDPFISCSLTLLERYQATTEGMIFNTRVLKETFLSDIEENVPLSSYDVIDRICKSLRCQLKMWDGQWILFCPMNLAASTVTLKTFELSQAYSGSSSYTPQLTFPVDGTRYAFTAPQYTFDLPYKSETGVWKPSNVYSAQKITSPPTKDELSFTITDVAVQSAPFQLEAEVTVLLGAAGVTRRPTVSGTSATSYKPYKFSRVFFAIKCGNYYLKKEVAGVRWVLNPPDKSISFDTENNSITTQKVQASLFIPKPPTGVSSIQIRCYAAYAEGTVSKAFNVKMTLEQQSNYPSTAAEFVIDKRIYSPNENATNMAKDNEDEIFFGDLSSATTVGSMEVYTGSTWVKSSQWKERTTDTAFLPFLNNYVNESMRVYKSPLYKCTGTFFMDTSFTPIKTINWRSRVLFFNAGKFTTEFCEWDGEFVQINNVANVRPFSGVRPTSLTDIQRINNQIDQIYSILNGVLDGQTSTADTLRSLTGQIDGILQTRSQNADKYLIANLEGIPDEPDVNATYPIKAIIGTDGIKLKFFSS